MIRSKLFYWSTKKRMQHSRLQKKYVFGNKVSFSTQTIIQKKINPHVLVLKIFICDFLIQDQKMFSKNQSYVEKWLKKKFNDLNWYIV